MSLVSSALSVVYPTMMPICVDLANQIGGTHPVALMSAVAEGGALAGTSPMSTGGALILAALGGELKKSLRKNTKIRCLRSCFLFRELIWLSC